LQRCTDFRSAAGPLAGAAYIPKHIERNARLSSLFFLDGLVKITGRAGLQLVMESHLDTSVAGGVGYYPADPAAVLSAIDTVIHRHIRHLARADAICPAFLFAAILEFPAVPFVHPLPFQVQCSRVLYDIVRRRSFSILFSAKIAA
jgi:hypothetical protein